MVRRAKSDGARGIFLVATNKRAPYFLCLKLHCTEQVKVEPDAGVFEHCVRQMPQHTLFAVDFGDKHADRASPLCGQETTRRRTGRAERVHETEECVALAQQAQSLAGDSRS